MHRQPKKRNQSIPPPRSVARLLGWIIPPIDLEYLLGDLEEEYYEFELPRRGSRRARRWYLLAGLSLAASYLYTRIRRGRTRCETVTLAARRHRRRSVAQARRTGAEQREERDPRMTFLQDIRFGLRTLRRAPLFTVTAIICIALGIGANGAVFPFIRAIVLNPLPYPESDRLVRIMSTSSDRPGEEIGASYTDFVEWQELNSTFADLASFYWTSRVLTGTGDPTRIDAIAMTWNMTFMLGVEPVQGRSFRPEEDTPGGDRVALIGVGLWQRRFGADPDLVGRTITLNGIPHTIVGIMPAGFRFPEHAELWIPMQLDPVTEQGRHYLVGVGRLKPDVTLAQAQSDLSTIAGYLAEEYPESNAGTGVMTDPLKRWMTETGRTESFVFQTAGLFILLLACANVANLLLALSTTRRREIAIRAALGAGRLRVIRQLITESLLLAGAGGALGVIVGRIGRDLMISGIPTTLPAWFDLSMDVPILLALIALTAVSGLIFGLYPAWESSRTEIVDTLRSGSPHFSGDLGRSRFRRLLITTEVALTLTLLVGAILMMKGLVQLHRVDLGFDPEHTISMDVLATGERYDESSEVVSYFSRVLERVRSLPDVGAAAITYEIPDGTASWGITYYVEGTDPAPPGQEPAAMHGVVSPGYFETLQLPLLKGRDFTDTDDGGAPPVAIVNTAFAERWWPGQNPVGKHISYGHEPGQGEAWLTVVGVVGNVHNRGFDEPASPHIYRPHAQQTENWMQLAVRTTGDPRLHVQDLRAAVWSIDPDIPLESVLTVTEILRTENWESYFFTYLFAIFTAIAILLAVAGVYGVVAVIAGQRTREFGIRLTLGADPGGIRSMVLKQGIRLSAIGVSLGTIVAYVGMQFAGAMMHGVNPGDPGVYVLAILLMGGITLVASFIPAQRTMRIDPVRTLQND